MPLAQSAVDKRINGRVCVGACVVALLYYEDHPTSGNSKPKTASHCDWLLICDRSIGSDLHPVAPDTIYLVCSCRHGAPLYAERRRLAVETAEETVPPTVGGLRLLLWDALTDGAHCRIDHLVDVGVLLRRALQVRVGVQLLSDAFRFARRNGSRRMTQVAFCACKWCVCV